jgi:ribosomal protein L11 methyltransferase
MNVYLAYHFTIIPLQPATEILVAELSALGFESFLENEDGITAYIQKKEWYPGMLATIPILKHADVDITYNYEELPPINWNAEWEKNFNPIEIDGICTIRASFHPKPNTYYDIVITPKMSFGTGHHETTRMMIQFLLKEEVKNKRLLDMGCGTGVLAILAEKRGAKYIDAVDIDPWCYLNTLENTAQNHSNAIFAYQGGVSLIKGKKYDVIVANINRNILIQDIPKYAACLAENGVLLLSGFYKEDLIAITKTCKENLLKFSENKELNTWIAAKYVN